MAPRKNTRALASTRELPAPPTVERKVYFYRINLSPHDLERLHECAPERLLAAIDNLSVADQSRYMEIDTETGVLVFPSTLDGLVRFAMGTARHGGLPQVEDAGNISPLNLERQQRLIEQSHIVFFDHGIVGAEFNYFGPRMTRLSAYLQTKCPDLPAISFQPLLNHDTIDRIEHLFEARFLELSIHRSYATLLDEATGSSAGTVLGLQAEALGGQMIRLRIQAERKSSGLLDRVKNVAKALVNHPQSHDAIRSLKLRAKDDRSMNIETFDLLKDHLVSVRRVAKYDPQHRGVEPESMYSEIIRAHGELRADLERAAGVGP